MDGDRLFSSLAIEMVPGIAAGTTEVPKTRYLQSNHQTTPRGKVGPNSRSDERSVIVKHEIAAIARFGQRLPSLRAQETGPNFCCEIEGPERVLHTVSGSKATINP